MNSWDTPVTTTVNPPHIEITGNACVCLWSRELLLNSLRLIGRVASDDVGQDTTLLNSTFNKYK